MKSDLPKGWANCTLGDIATLKNGYAFKSSNYLSEGIPVIRISDINDWIVDSKHSVRVTPEDTFNDYTISYGDMLIAMSGATTGKFGIYKSNEIAFQNQRVGNLKPHSDKINKDFLFYFLHSAKREIEKLAYGGAQPNISPTKVHDIPLYFPPFNEQKRIVAKIEELFSELDNGIESLKTARKKLSIYRQAILKHAFEGKLTHKWREDNGISEKWEFSTLGKSGDWSSGGTPSKQNSSYWDNGNILWVSPKDMKSRVVKDTLQKVTKEGVDNSSVKMIEKESVLFVVRSGIIRRILPISMAVASITVNQDMQAMMPNKHGLKFVYWYCQGHEWNIRNACSKDGTTVESIDVAKLKAYPIPVPSKEEQEEIINQIESILSQIDELEVTIDEEIQKSHALRQSIFKEAFSGKLVAQDPADEPASVLLERIKAEKESSAKSKKKAQTKIKKTKKKENNVIPFPNSIASVTTTDLHAGIIALAYAAHEKQPSKLNTYGKVKAEKISHLVEYHLGVSLGRNPVKDVAGPNDYNHLKKVEHRANRANWFSVSQRNNGNGYNFSKKSGFNSFINKTKSNLGDLVDEVENLIGLFVPMDTQQAEIVATTYAAWNNLLIAGNKNPSDDDIVTEARENWHQSKMDIDRDRFFKSLEWMREKKLTPKGLGAIVPAKETA